jgi:pimeloyl-ACP methyl ester carboxylesterase
MPELFKVESLLAARLFMSPQLVGERIYFLSDLSGRMSLYSMDKAGSVPQPLLPPDIALQNPILMNGESFFVFPRLAKILVMIDSHGDENYQPMLIPLEGGIPQPLAGERFRSQQVNCAHCDPEQNLAFFQVDPRSAPAVQAFMADLATGQLTSLGESLYGNWFEGANADYSRVVLIDSYTTGDEVVYLWEKECGERHLLYGKPLEQRQEGESVPLNSIGSCCFVPSGRGLLLFTSLFDDSYGLGYMPFDDPAAVRPVEIAGTVHSGLGELTHLEHLSGDRYLVTYNIDGCSWAYEGAFDEEGLHFQAGRIVCGQGVLSNGVLQSLSYEKETGSYALAFSTATSPTQIYTLENGRLLQHTHERILGISQSLLSPGEDASYTSHDGLRVSARLYLPADELGFQGARPVIFYIHGGPQSQERPDFAWFSMPLIQFLTLNGFAVFVPNVRGSSGYGLSYMRRIEHDWGGQDRLDHVAAWHQLRSDARLDMSRAGVTGRSYGGYMTLALAGRHPELWRAAIDLFGPYNLFTFVERLPEAWKTYFYLELGHPDRDKELYAERSPSTYLPQLACPMLVIQGANDPRVREAESRDLVEQLRARGKDISLLVFENEGHDVIKLENKVRCYNEMVQFFAEHLA